MHRQPRAREREGEGERFENEIGAVGRVDLVGLAERAAESRASVGLDDVERERGLGWLGRRRGKGFGLEREVALGAGDGPARGAAHVNGTAVPREAVEHTGGRRR